MAGYGAMEAKCRVLQSNSPFTDQINIVGRVDEQEGNRLRTQADIFTAHNCRGSQTQQEEAFGVSYVEAMAAAIPVVTGRSGGVCEAVTHGETGFLFESGDVEGSCRSVFAIR